MTRQFNPAAMLVLLTAAALVALAYGLALPVLPLLLERRLGPGADVAWHTGLLTGTYMLGLFLFAPFWGWLSDRTERRRIILLGLGGFAAALFTFAFIDSLAAAYAGRFLSGAFSAAIVPVSYAMVAGYAADDQLRARRFAWLNIAALAGALAGPAIGGFLGAMWSDGMPVSGAPFMLLALAAAGVAAVSFFALPRDLPTVERIAPPDRGRDRPTILRLLLLSFVMTWGLGTFEVGLALRARTDFALDEPSVGRMFVECMAVMALAQALIFNRWVAPLHTRRLIAPAFLVLSAGIYWLGFADTDRVLSIAVISVAAAAGVLAPVIGYWISMSAGRLQGTELGRQTAASALGQAAGSAAAGLLFAVPWRGAGFLLAAGMMLAGAAVALPLSRALSTSLPKRA